jgi:hypothetical protein
MSKLNPQNATAYVGPGVLRKGGKITPVPNGPLIKKTGKFKGSTLKAGGKIKKAAYGSTVTSETTISPKLTPQQEARRKLDSITAIKRADIIRKKDSIFERNARAKGMTKEELSNWQTKNARKPDQGPSGGDNYSGSGLKSPCKGGFCTGLNKSKNGTILKKAQNGTSQYSDPKPLFDKIKKSKDSLDNAMFKLEEKKFKSNTNYLKGKLKNEQSIMNSKKAKTGAMIKRADGSFSKRGLWDNIRKNKGSGKKPTAEMLKQERKIKAKK